MPRFDKTQLIQTDSIHIRIISHTHLMQADSISNRSYIVIEYISSLLPTIAAVSIVIFMIVVVRARLPKTSTIRISTDEHQTKSSTIAADVADERHSSPQQLTLETMMNEAMRRMTDTLTKQSNSPGVDGETIPNEYLIKKISNTLPDSWEVGVTIHGRIYYIE